MNDDGRMRERLERIERLLQDVDNFPDAKMRAQTRAIVQGVLELHGTALTRLCELLAVRKDGRETIDAVAQDELVGSILLLHGLHPLDFDTRVRQALEDVRPLLHSQGGKVELIGTQDGVVRLRMEGAHHCPSSAQMLKSSIENAIFSRAPDALGIDVESAGGHLEQGRWALPVLS